MGSEGVEGWRANGLRRRSRDADSDSDSDRAAGPLRAASRPG